VILASFDVEQNRRQRVAWGVFRDRRPELYGDILTLDGSQRR
jgi:N-carbamoylputrescine amidase